MTQTLSELRQLPHLSVSQLKTFLQCPRKYRYQYIDRSLPAFRPIALAFGTAWHEAVGHHLLVSTAGEPVDRDELCTVFRDALRAEVMRDGPPVLFEDNETLDETIELGLRMVNVFVATVPLPRKILGVEIPFALELVHPVTEEVVPLPLIGGIDALVVEDNTLAVWELKSGKKKWSADQLEFDTQPTAYTMAARELGHENATLKLLVTTKTKTPAVQVENLVRRQGDETEFVQTALDVLSAVKAGVDYRVRSWACRSCAHASVCTS